MLDCAALFGRDLLYGPCFFKPEEAIITRLILSTQSVYEVITYQHPQNLSSYPKMRSHEDLSSWTQSELTNIC